MLRSVSDECFPLAESYRLLQTPVPAVLREKRHPAAPAFLHTERHLKCVWFDAALRPDILRAHNGDIVIVEHPGRWNLESGPDFLGAALRIGTAQAPQKRKAAQRRVERRVTGDVEIHITPADWERHGHSQDPAYGQVKAHVTYFPGYLPSGILPRGALQISLKEGLMANPLFSFGSIDVTAYPFVVHAQTTPCAQILSKWDSDQLIALFEAAGQERFRRKAERMTVAIQEKGADQVLYEEVMNALGYKKNRNPFRYLAEQLPLEALREESHMHVMAAYSLLMGVAGLIPNQMKAQWDGETRSFVRQLWNYWWKYQSRWHSRTLNRTAWDLKGLRPQNHPQRRLVTAALLFCRKPYLNHQLLEVKPDQPRTWMNKTMALLQPCSSSLTYWNFRLSLSGTRQSTPISLTGQRRAAAIVSNVVIPLLAIEQPNAVSFELLRRLAPEEDNSIVRQTAYSLLGPDHNPSLYRTGLRQQGLIQIFHDFCLNDRSACRSCLLPGTLDQFTP